MNVIPAILPYSFSELKEKLEFLKGVSNLVQIDVTDGEFAGRASWPLNKVDENFKKIVKQEEGFPFWEDFEFEIDLMCKEPFSVAKDFISAGAHRIIFHLSSLHFEDDKLMLDQIKTEGIVEVGLGIHADDDFEDVKEVIPYVDFVQVMGIKRIGYQGESFYEASLEMIKKIKKDFPHIQISVDGGVSPETASLFEELGVDNLVSGSFILNSPNPISAVRELKGLV